MPEITFTDHTFYCQDCGRKSRASVEVMTMLRAEALAKGNGDVDDDVLASDLQWCLSCLEGREIPGEHETDDYACLDCGKPVSTPGGLCADCQLEATADLLSSLPLQVGTLSDAEDRIMRDLMERGEVRVDASTGYYVKAR